MQNFEFLREYLSTLNCEGIDGFRKLFYESSDTQLSLIQEKLKAASDDIKFLYNDEGVEACYIRKLGGELALIALYHNFEVKIKQIIRLSKPSMTEKQLKELHKWNKYNTYIPEYIKNTIDYDRLEILRLLVNCFKHSGIVEEDLYKKDTSFGNIEDEINADLEDLYEKYKKSVEAVITATAEQLLFKN
ncbi:hypothetical protein [Methylomonas koyamae]|uniref:Uncharacterized protein n=1 Tax=Methylomonas koyamae TaxID=702114 RepID=A0A291II43_9GAMM|nr:hypothetical protein [Methylomonas koyamae]ATG89866.1 hypothetical protein MKLM6_1623 [Methylomonas koyamae]OAI29433.1 hypothetical protein A1356_23225 [Methylomonas koyamae]